jgi:integrase
LKHLQTHVNENEIPFNVLSSQWFENLKKYFGTAKGLKCKKSLSTNSANTYFSIIISVSREAANDGFINHNILTNVKNLQPRIQAEASPLSFKELQRLASTDCKPSDLKKAYLFSCLTGIQWRDIEILKWNQIIPLENGTWEVVLLREGEKVKTPLSTQARDLLGIGGHPNKSIFNLHYSAALCVSLNKWALRAGISRNITFHSARQTFGRMLLDQGVELELISELLGHKHVKTTTKFLSVKASSVPITSNYLRAFNI